MVRSVLNLVRLPKSMSWSSTCDHTILVRMFDRSNPPHRAPTSPTDHRDRPALHRRTRATAWPVLPENLVEGWQGPRRELHIGDSGSAAESFPTARNLVLHGQSAAGRPRNS